MGLKADVVLTLAELQAMGPYADIFLPSTLPDGLRPTCTALPILLAERFIVLVPTGQEQAVIDGYLQALAVQKTESAMLERFQRVALGHAAVCVVDSLCLWLPQRLVNWLGVQFEMQRVSDREVRLVNMSA